MKITKRILTTLNGCYAANSLVVDGQTQIMLASESEDGACLAWSGADYEASHTVWEGPGGAMSMVQIPGSNGEFLAIQKFFRMYDWEGAKIVHVRKDSAGAYHVSDLIDLPYVHRFDLLTVDGRNYFIACTLATHKDSVADWANPGQVWVGEYSDGGLSDLRVLKSGLTANHGYSRLVVNGAMRALVTCQEGAFEITPPPAPDAPWSVIQLMDWPISDISAIDIDGDGELEYATIEAFHGSYFRIYKKIDGQFKRIFEHPEVSEFYHVVLGTRLAGQPVFIGGCRRGKQQLFYVQARSSAPLELCAELIDDGVGPSNVHVVHEATRDIIVSANRENNEAALYFVA